MNKHIVFSFIITASSLSLFGCVGVCRRDLMNHSDMGQKANARVKNIQDQAVAGIDQQRKLFDIKKQELVNLQQKIQDEAALFQKENLDQNSDRYKQKDAELHSMLDSFEKNKKELQGMQQQLDNNIKTAEKNIKYKRDQESVKFNADVICRYAPLNNWNIVFAQEDKCVAYINPKINKTNTLLTSLDKQIKTHKKSYTTSSEVKELFADLGIIYLDKTKVSSTLQSEMQNEYSSYYDENKKHIDINTQRYLSLVKKSYRVPLSVKWVADNVGFGVFAEQEIRQGDFVQEYTGVVQVAQTQQGLLAHDSSYAWMYPSFGEYNDNLLVDSKYEGNEMRFVNHGNHPNLVQVKILDEQGMYHICYIAKQDIKAGEQLLISYGLDYWATRDFFEDLG